MRKMVVLDPAGFEQMLRTRRQARGDRFDEVWNGVYIVSPEADNEHQKLIGSLFYAIYSAVGWDDRTTVQTTGNVSDRDDNWTKNYRVPDVMVFLPGNPAEDRGTHYYGGPDFAVEILSPRDRSRKKFKFYAKVGVRELLLIDRNPWRLELYRLRDGTFGLAGTSDAIGSQALASDVLPLTFRLRPGDPRPRIEVTRPADGRVWSA